MHYQKFVKPVPFDKKCNQTPFHPTNITKQAKIYILNNSHNLSPQIIRAANHPVFPSLPAAAGGEGWRAQRDGPKDSYGG